MAAYFADGVSLVYPELDTCCDGPVWTKTMEIAKEITACPAKDHTKYVYEKSFDITMGQEYMGSTITSVAVDTRGSHKKAPLKFRVFEDAHVE